MIPVLLDLVVGQLDLSSFLWQETMAAAILARPVVWLIEACASEQKAYFGLLLTTAWRCIPYFLLRFFSSSSYYFWLWFCIFSITKSWFWTRGDYSLHREQNIYFLYCLNWCGIHLSTIFVYYTLGLDGANLDKFFLISFSTTARNLSRVWLKLSVYWAFYFTLPMSCIISNGRYQSGYYTRLSIYRLYQDAIQRKNQGIHLHNVK